MPQPNILDRILELVQKNGPTLPVDIASKLGMDSFLASAYMQQLVEQGKLFAGKERVGGSQIFFIPGQEASAELRIRTLLEASKKTARTFSKEVSNNPEVQKKREEFAARLSEIESKERKSKLVEPHAVPQPGHKVMPITIKHVSEEVGDIPERAVGGLMMPKPHIKEPIPEIKPETKTEMPKTELASHVEEVHYEAPKLEIVKPAPIEDGPGFQKLLEPKSFKKPEKPMEPSPLVDAALAMLVDAGADIISKELKKKGKEADIIFDMPTKIGNLKMLAAVRYKKSITDADLSMAFAEGTNMKLVVVFITNGKLTKPAQAYLQSISGLLKFKQIESK